MSAPRLVVVGAFPYPVPQGSQVFAAGQVRALRAAGAEATLLCYGRGVGEPDADVPVRTIPPGLSPRRLRSGLSAAKAAADAALAALLVREARRAPVAAVLAHNVEAALVALATRPLHGAPVVYVAHTLMGVELPSHLPERLRARATPGQCTRRLGSALDRLAARGADAVIALSSQAASALRPDARGEVALIPPGHETSPATTAAERERVCRAAGVPPGRFALYTGNLDAYQDLELLEAAAARGISLVAATHDARGAERLAHVRIFQARDWREMRALIGASGVLVLPRRRAPGFPIKLLNYLESGRPVVASAGSGHGLVHGESAWLLPECATPTEWSDAVASLLACPERGRRTLGEAGRSWLEQEHGWPRRARETLALVERALMMRAGRRLRRAGCGY